MTTRKRKSPSPKVPRLLPEDEYGYLLLGDKSDKNDPIEDIDSVFYYGSDIKITLNRTTLSLPFNTAQAARFVNENRITEVRNIVNIRDLRTALTVVVDKDQQSTIIPINEESFGVYHLLFLRRLFKLVGYKEPPLAYSELVTSYKDGKVLPKIGSNSFDFSGQNNVRAQVKKVTQSFIQEIIDDFDWEEVKQTECFNTDIKRYWKGILKFMESRLGHPVRIDTRLVVMIRVLMFEKMKEFNT